MKELEASITIAPITLALAGQPNVGKSTVFNTLTGQTQYVSNWPGKTCELKTGLTQYAGKSIQIVDLPGTYGLTANSIEEGITRDYILQGQPDIVVVIVDAVSLERNLYLVAELLCLPVPLVLGLNRIDLAGQQGIRIEPHVLEAALGIPVVPMVASRSEGVRELLAAALQVASSSGSWAPSRPEIRADHQSVLEEIESLISGYTPALYPPDWLALKLLEGDGVITRMICTRMGSEWEKVHAILIQHEDAFLAVVGGRYEWIGRMVRAAVARPKAGQVTLTDRLDRAATHPTWGLLILLGILGLLFWLTYSVGAPLQNWMETNVVQGAVVWTRHMLTGSPPWLAGLLADGVITGVGTVLTLMPILIIFFTVLGLLEDVGYMARAAYVMDRFMHWMGLHGKSFLPIFLGFGCNVPAVMGTRIIDSPKARLITILVTPLVPCTARMSVIALLAPIFFFSKAVWVSWGLVGLSLLVLMGIGIALHELFLGGEHTVFIMELPLYQAANLRRVGQGIWQRTVDFLKMAGSIILVVSMLLWALSTFPGGAIESSYLAFFGRLLAPLGRLMGLEWQMMVALLTSFVRKENTIPTLAVLYGAEQSGAGLADLLSGRMPPAAALAFLAVQMLFIPCVATLAAIRQETGSWRWTALSVLLLLVVSMLAGVAIYQGARLVGWGV